MKIMMKGQIIVLMIALIIGEVKESIPILKANGLPVKKFVMMLTREQERCLTMNKVMDGIPGIRIETLLESDENSLMNV